MTRAKFRCDGITRRVGGAHDVELSPVVGGKSKENDEFFKWTPSGALKLAGVQTTVADQFEPGKEYYIDIFEAVEVA